MKTWRLLVTIAVLALMFYSVRHLSYLLETDHARTVREISQISATENINVGGYEDITFNVTNVSFRIASKAGSTIVIQRPKDSSIGTSRHLLLERLGPWEFTCYIYEKSGYSYSSPYRLPKSGWKRNFIDIGPDGEFGTMLPVKINNVNDLVAHYDELINYFGTFPDDTRWGSLDDQDGYLRRYCRMPFPTVAQHKEKTPPSD